MPLSLCWWHISYHVRLTVQGKVASESWLVICSGITKSRMLHHTKLFLTQDNDRDWTRSDCCGSAVWCCWWLMPLTLDDLRSRTDSYPKQRLGAWSGHPSLRTHCNRGNWTSVQGKQLWRARYRSQTKEGSIPTHPSCLLAQTQWQPLPAVQHCSDRYHRREGERERERASSDHVLLLMFLSLLLLAERIRQTQ